MINRQNILELIIAAECFANCGFTDLLVQEIESQIVRESENSSHFRIRVKVLHIGCREEKVFHTPEASRDNVLKKIVKLLNMYKMPVIGLAIIDYETGNLRK